MNRRSKRITLVATAAIFLIMAALTIIAYIRPFQSDTVIAATAQPSGAPKTLAVHYLDVGQGDSEFIELPNGKTMLIDAGTSENGDDIVRYIKAAGHDTIDILVATHPHADHIGGLETVVKGLKITSVYMPKTAENTKTYTDLLKVILAKGLTVKTAKAGVSVLNEGGLEITLLGPVSSGYDNLNNYSAVVRLVYKGTSFLFTGDAETLAENEIVKSGAHVAADVLKVGHHGSDTSTGKAFLQAVSPKIAVISVGAGNDYGHPDPTTLTKLTKAVATVYRTDKNGTVTVISDGDKISVNTKKKG